MIVGYTFFVVMMCKVDGRNFFEVLIIRRFSIIRLLEEKGYDPVEQLRGYIELGNI